MEWMRWEQPCAGTLDHERLWFGVGLGAIAAGAGWVRSGWSWPACLFHLATGCPCPGCGSTRAVLQFTQGNLGAAFRWNPLATVALLVAAGYAFYAATVVLLCLPRLRLAVPTGRLSVFLRLVLVAAVLGNWFWLIADGR